MSNAKKDVKFPKLVMSLVKKSQTEGVIITTLLEDEFDCISVSKTAS